MIGSMWLIALALAVWTVISLSGIRQELKGVRDALREIAGRLDGGSQN